jgi:hypothetical protein
MAYQLNKSNGTNLILLNDGLVDTTSTSLTLIGKNVSNYGDAQNENFIYLLENFASSFQPRSPTTGQIWFDTNARVFRPAVFDGANWRSLAVLQYSNTTTDTLVNAGGNNFAASSPGDLWFNSSSKQLFVITSTSTGMTLIGPESLSGYGVTKMRSAIMLDTSANSHPVIQAVIDDEVIGVISTSTFNSTTTNSVPGFVNVSRGITLKNYDSTSSTTIFKSTEIYDSGARVITTATFSAYFASNFTFNVSGTDNQINVLTNGNTSTISLPNTVDIHNLRGAGTSNTGTITGNWSLSAGSTLQATYADLAECYQADANYEPGTVLEFGGDFEVTVAEDSTRRVAGVVSTDPAFLLNRELIGDNVIRLALQGRVPCKVRGKVEKGDMMVAAGGGFARASYSPILGSVIGKALENFDGIEGVIEVVVGRL